jgi:cbb3-type cytochrome oxidase maturation protein
LESLYLLIPLSVIAAFAAGWVLWRAVDGGQFDDLEGPAHRILMDDDAPAAAPTSATRADFDPRQKPDSGSR